MVWHLAAFFGWLFVYLKPPFLPFFTAFFLGLGSVLVPSLLILIYKVPCMVGNAVACEAGPPLAQRQKVVVAGTSARLGFGV